MSRYWKYISSTSRALVQNTRIVKEIGLDNPRECLGYRLITKSVERTADHATKIAENVLALKDQINPKLLEKIDKLSNLAISMFESAVEALFKHDYDLAETVIEKIDDVRKRENDAVLSSQNFQIEQLPNLRLLIESTRRTAEYASDISEVVLNLDVESVLT